MNKLLEQARAAQNGGQNEVALALARQAVAAAPDDPVAWTLLGELLATAQERGEGVAAFRRAIELAPEMAEAHFRLASLLHEMDLALDAETAYLRVLELLPGCAPAHFNLGNLYFDERRLTEAEACFRRAQESRPDEPDAEVAYNLGKTLSEQNNLEGAASAYREAIQIDPQFFRAHSNLGNVLFELLRVEDAVQAHQRAIEIDPAEHAEHFQMGRALMTLGKLAAAETSFRECLRLMPGAAAAYEAISRILINTGRSAELTALADDWERATPGDPRVAHMRAAWTGENVAPRASDSYVRKLFDGFAETFDSTLKRLDYRAPERLSELLIADGRCAAGPVDILDAGCGTGLCGPLLRPLAKKLVGVDLSAGMLQQARKLGLYDELAEQELTRFLASRENQFDVIVSADTLVYFGDLTELLSAAEGALQSDGRLVVSLEHAREGAPECGYRLDAHGRYAHTLEYIRGSLAAAGLEVVVLEEDILRSEGGLPVFGLVVVAKKKA